MMKITYKDKSVEIPNWLVVLGLITVSKVSTNICKMKVAKEDDKK